MITPAYSGYTCLHTDEIIHNLQTKFLELNNIEDTVQNRNKVIPTLQSLGKIMKEVTKKEKNKDLIFTCVMTAPTRNKRGLCNFCGKIQKFLYGTPTHDDLMRIDDNIQNVTDSTNIIKTSVQKQSAIIRKLATETGHYIKELQQAQNRITYILPFMSYIDTLLFDINNVILAIETKKVLPQLIEPYIILDMIDKLLKESKSDHVFNYYNETRTQHFMDISDKLILIRKNNLIFELTIPKLENDKWDLYNVIPIPQIYNETYIVTTPEYSHLLRQGDNYMITNEIEILHMKNIDDYHITHYTHPIYNRVNRPTCQNDIKRCKISKIKITEMSYISLYDNHGILLIPEIGQPTLVNVQCKDYVSEIYIKEVTLLKTADKCILSQGNTKVILNGFPKEHRLVNPSQTYLTINFSQLTMHTKNVSHQIDISYLQNIGQDLDEMEKDLEKANIVLKHDEFWNTMNGALDN